MQPSAFVIFLKTRFRQRNFGIFQDALQIITLTRTINQKPCHHLRIFQNTAKIFCEKKAVKMLKSVKAPEKDSVSYEIRKRSNKAIVESLQFLFNKINDTGYYPKSWNYDFVCPNKESGLGGTYNGPQDIRD